MFIFDYVKINTREMIKEIMYIVIIVEKNVYYYQFIFKNYYY